MKCLLWRRRKKSKSTEIFPPFLLKPTDICARTIKSQKRSAEGSKFKDKDRALSGCPSLEVLLYGLDIALSSVLLWAREQEKLSQSVRKLQQSEEDFVEKNDKLRKFNSEKYKEVEDERHEVAHSLH